MKRFSIFLTVISVLVGMFLLTGCEDANNPVQKLDTYVPTLSAAKVTLPANATLESATLNVYVFTPNTQLTSLHSITSAWDESVVTWNNFGGSFDATTIGSFSAATEGWYSVDVTDLVKSWMDGSVENFGILLKQSQNDMIRMAMNSREAIDNHPYLEVCYAVDEVTTCENSDDIADSYIWALGVFADVNYGSDPELLAGWVSGGEKQALLLFETPEQDEEPELGALGDYVWNDTDMDGIQDDGEPGIPGITVQLLDCYGEVLDETTTNADGYYLFSDLPAGDYTVRFVVPEGYVLSPMDQGTDDGLDSDADMVTGETVCITLGEGQIDLTWDAGMYMPEPELGALGDYVWHDTNMDGIQDDGEPGISRIMVQLLDCYGEILDQTITDANGYYLFSDLPAGDYTVRFVVPGGYVLSPMDQGTDDGLDSDADMVTGETICITLGEGQIDLTWDAGMYHPPFTGCARTIGYWKNHAGFGPQADVVSQYLPIRLGDEGGAKSLEVTDAAMAVAILKQKTYGRSSNGITKLYAQLLAAKLNLASGADSIDIDEALAKADAFLADHDWTDWNSLSKISRKQVLKLKNTFDAYNNGEIGPGHCDEAPPM